MQKAPELPDDEERLCALQDLHQLDTPAEERFDRLTRLAREIFQVPIALVSLVDKDRQWFKSRQGLDVPETPRDISFCGHAIASDGIFLIEDTLQDERFRDNPLVMEGVKIRFYAGYPLRMKSGRMAGTLCIIDTKPRRFDNKQCQQLRDLGVLVETELRQQPPIAEWLRDKQLQTSISQSTHTALTWMTSRTGAIFSSLLAAVGIFSLFLTWDSLQLQNHRNEATASAMEKLALVRGTVETSLNSKLYMVHGLSGFARAEGEINDDQFQTFASELGMMVPSIRSLQLAPGGIVTHVWPLFENRKAIGHDLLADPTRRAAAEQAIKARQLWMAGPLKLIQGGTALIGRHPIFMPDMNDPRQEKFWGFATILLDMDEFLAEVGLQPSDKQYNYALRGKNSMGSEGDVFFGDPEVFNHQPLIGDISLPAGNWQLAIVPIKGWPEQWPNQDIYRLAATFITLLILSLVYFLLRLPHHTRLAVDHATAALELSEHRFRDAIESLPEGIAIYDPNGRLAVHNERFREIYDRTRADIETGSTYQHIVRKGLEKEQFLNLDASSPEAIDKLVEKALNQFQVPESRFEQGLHDGRCIRVIERRMRDGGRVTLHMDITEQKHNEAELVNAREKAEQANEAKTTFLATISHEVRTPLNGVLGLLTVLRDDKSLNETQHNYVLTAQQSARQLLGLLNEILDISKMEAGKLELETIPFQIGDTIRGAVDLIRSQASAKSLTVETDISETLNSTVMGDEGRLRQIILNLLSNAVKFTDKGKITVKAITRQADSEQLSASIQISDTGIGFNNDERERLFQPFKQMDSNSTRKISGTGLGLSICKHLIESMGGSIDATSQPGKGANFTLELTLKRAEKSQQTAHEKQAPLPINLGWPPVRILLAEDSATNQMVIQAMLTDTGYIIDTANNGLEAVEALKSFNYDLVLMDIFMPEMDGVTATQEIRKIDTAQETPIIALTANAMKGDRERYIETGMDDFLTKPVDKQELLAVLYRWASEQRDKA